ncbi:NlpC/P60 family protein [Plantactinospora siamensis]|uniref:NlpC/P60 family protein n=1 Tax=Plantactinospora siamensis TaxID=555372 RepID=A0ABV6NX96_9ACTN
MVVPTNVSSRRLVSLAASVVIVLGAAPGAALAAPDPAGTARQLADASEQLEVVVEDYNDLHEDLLDTQARIAALGVELANLERGLADRRGQVARIAATAYRTGRTDTVAVLAVLDGNSSDLVESLMTLQQLGRDQRDALNRLTDSRDRLTVARRDARALAAAQQSEERQLDLRKRQIEGEIVRLTELRRAAGRAAAGPRAAAPAPAPAPPPAAGGAGARAVRFAYAQLGKSYRWGASGPDGYDCSGLTSAAWAAAGVRLPHNAARQWRAVPHVGRSELRPGDLIFYYPSIHHVAIYVGGGRMIHAPRTGEQIRVDAVDSQPVHGYGRPGG